MPRIDKDDVDDTIDNDPLEKGSGRPAVEQDERSSGASVRDALKKALIDTRKDVKKEEENIDDESEKVLPKKYSVRNSLKDTVKQFKKDELAREKDEKVEDEKVKDEKVEVVDDAKEEKTAKKADEVVDGDKTPPAGWTKEAKTLWQGLPEDIKKAVAKRENEVSVGFKEYGAKAKRLETFDGLVQRYAPDLPTYGATPVQLVERTLQWMNSFQNPNKQHVANSFKELAKNFGIEKELASLFNGASNKNEVVTSPASDIPESLQPIIGRLEAEVKAMRDQHTQNARATAERTLEQWSKDKPHFNKVRQSMFVLLNSGTVPLKNNVLDLDKAYSMAVRQDEELYSQELSDIVSKKELEFLETQKSKNARREKDATVAKKANVSLAPNKKTMEQTSSAESKPKNGRKISVGESIRAALREINN